MYLDTSYVAKLYLAEPESALVEALVFKTHPVRTSRPGALQLFF